jgi:hypothetical protein
MQYTLDILWKGTHVSCTNRPHTDASNPILLRDVLILAAAATAAGDLSTMAGCVVIFSNSELRNDNRRDFLQTPKHLRRWRLVLIVDASGESAPLWSQGVPWRVIDF